MKTCGEEAVVVAEDETELSADAHLRPSRISRRVVQIEDLEKHGFINDEVRAHNLFGGGAARKGHGREGLAVLRGCPVAQLPLGAIACTGRVQCLQGHPEAGSSWPSWPKAS